MAGTLTDNRMSLTQPKRERFLSRLARPEVALFLLVIVFAGPIIHHWGEQQISRYAMTASLWDNQSVVIDDYAHLLGRDRAVVDGTTYSDKAPGQPFLMVPFYGMYRLVGGASPADAYDPETDLGMWWVTFWSAAVPGAILAVMMFRWAREIEPRTAMLAAVTMSLGTLLLVYSTILFGHVLAATLVFGMFMLVRKANAPPWRLAAAGALGGAAVLVEYPVVLVVVLVTLAAFVKHRSRGFAVLAGGVPAALLLGIYQWRLFGDPFTYTYRWSAFSGPHEQANEFLGFFNGLSLDRFTHVLISPRGLFIATPIIAIALLGLLPMFRRGLKFDAIVALACFLAMLAVPSLWGNSYAGGAGPRYVIPGLPFLVAPLAVAWSRWRILASFAGAVSLITMIAATLTEPQMATEFEAGLLYWLVLATNAEFEPTIYSIGVGWVGVIVYVCTIAVAGVFLTKVAQDNRALVES